MGILDSKTVGRYTGVNGGFIEKCVAAIGEEHGIDREKQSAGYCCKKVHVLEVDTGPIRGINSYHRINNWTLTLSCAVWDSKGEREGELVGEKLRRRIQGGVKKMDMRKGAAFRRRKKERELIREKVFRIVQESKYGVDTHEIARRARMKIHCISGRLSELEQEGRIYQRARVYKEQRHSCTIWQVTPAELIEARRAEVWNRRFLLWMEKGVRNGFVTRKDLDKVKKQATLF